MLAFPEPFLSGLMTSEGPSNCRKILVLLVLVGAQGRAQDICRRLQEAIWQWAVGKAAVLSCESAGHVWPGFVWQLSCCPASDNLPGAGFLGNRYRLPEPLRSVVRSSPRPYLMFSGTSATRSVWGNAETLTFEVRHRERLADAKDHPDGQSEENFKRLSQDWAELQGTAEEGLEPAWLRF